MKKLYTYNSKNFPHIDREEYDVQSTSAIFFLGYVRRCFVGKTVEVWDSPTGGSKYSLGLDYVLSQSAFDIANSKLVGESCYSGIKFIRQTGKIYISYDVVASYATGQLTNEHEERLNEVDAILDSHGGRLDNIENVNVEQATSITEINNALDNHEARITGLEFHKIDPYSVTTLEEMYAIEGCTPGDICFVAATNLFYSFIGEQWIVISEDNWNTLKNIPQVLKDFSDDGETGLKYKGSAIGEGGSSLDWSAVENVPQVLNDLSDDGTGLKYKGADIGTGGGESTPSPAVTNLVNNSKVFVDPVIYNTVLTNNATPLQWSAIANNGTDVYASIANLNAGGGAGIYKLNKSTGIFEIYYAHDQANIFGIACVGNDLYYCTNNGNPNGGYIYKQTNYTGDFVSLNVPIKYWTAMCTNGKDLYLAAWSDDLYKLPNCTGNLVAQNAGVKNWSCVAANENDDVYAGVDMGDIYYKPSGSSIYTAMGQTSRSYIGLYVYNYDTIFACAQNEGIYVRANGYGNFAQSKAIGQPVKGVTVLNDTLYACAHSRGIYTARVVRGTDIYSTEEVPTNDFWLGHRVYRKVINYGALPKTGMEGKAHGIPTPYKTKSVTGIASNGSDELPLPHTNPSSNAASIYVHIRRTDNTVVVGVGVDRSAYEAYITIEYIKALI